MISCWHALWVEGAPTGAVYLRCRVGFENEALDHTLPHELQNGMGEGNSATSPLAFGNFHVEFLKVRGFERTLRRMGLASEDPSRVSPQLGNGLHWDGAAYLAEAPGSGGEGCTESGGASAPVASGWAVAVGARGRPGSRPLFVQISLAGGRLSNDRMDGVKTLKAVSCVPPKKLVPIATVPGSELLEWFPCVCSAQVKHQDKEGAERGRCDQHTEQYPTPPSPSTAADVKDGSTGVKPEAGEADTGQVLLSIRYAPLAVGVLDVAVCEAQLAEGNPRSSGLGNLRALTRILPAQTGGAVGHKARRTPGRRGVRTTLPGDERKQYMVYSWEDTCPHRMRFGNAFNKQPTTLHVSVVQSDRMIGFTSVGVEAIVHDAMANMAREIKEGQRKPRGSAHDVGPVGVFEDDFSDSVQAWYTLHAPLTGTGAETSSATDDRPPWVPPSASTEVGRIRVEIRFAPHPNVLVRNWQEGAAVTRATGIAAMKAIFYRLNRSGSLVVDTEDLRQALADAVDTFLANSSTKARGSNTPRHETSRASHAGEFVLLMSQGIKSNKGLERGVALAESAADSILAMMDRDRTAEVTFTEFCAFLSQAAAWQAEAAVEDLMSELAEENDDERYDNDSEDDVDGGCPDGDGVRSLDGRVSRVGEPLARRVTSPTLPVDDDNHPSMDKVRTDDTKSKLSPRRAFSGSSAPGQESAKSPTSGRPAGSTGPKVARQGHPPARSTKCGDTEIDQGTNEQATSQAVRKEGMAYTQVPRQPLPKDVTLWTVSQVLSWLTEDMQLRMHANKFQEASIDGLVLCDLSDTLLKENLGISDPLHRLKILRHVQKLRKQQQRAHQSQASGKTSWVATTKAHQSGDAREPLLPPSRSNGVEVAAAHSPDGRSSVTGDNSNIDGVRKPQLPATPAIPYEAKTLGEPDAPTSPRHVSPTHTDQGGEETARRRDIADKKEDLPVAQGLGIAVSSSIGEESGPGERLGQSGTADLLLRQRKQRQLPAYATTTEVHEVVQTAMWKAADLLEESSRSDARERRQVRELDDYPPAWWGSSEGGSMSRSDRSINDGGIPHALSGGRNDERTSENQGQREARLLFNQFCSLRTAERSECPSKLTRHKLELGIRSFLQIEMKWEQWQFFLDSIASLRTHGYLTPDEFSKEFAFHHFLRRPRTPDSQSSQPESTSGGSIELEADRTGSSHLAIETTTGWGSTAAQDMTELREFVLGIADALRTCRPTLGDVVSKFDRRGTGEVGGPGELTKLAEALVLVMFHQVSSTHEFD